MTTLAKARELAPIVERVHGPHHPEMARIRELTDAVGVETGNDDQLFAELRDLTNNYNPPADTCETVEALYGALKDADRNFAN